MLYLLQAVESSSSDDGDDDEDERDDEESDEESEEDERPRKQHRGRGPKPAPPPPPDPTNAYEMDRHAKVLKLAGKLKEIQEKHPVVRAGFCWCITNQQSNGPWQHGSSRGEAAGRRRVRSTTGSARARAARAAVGPAGFTDPRRRRASRE